MVGDIVIDRTDFIFGSKINWIASENAAPASAALSPYRARSFISA